MQRQVYQDAQAACGIEPGDEVLIFRKARNYEAGWGCVWVPLMNDSLGCKGVVVAARAEGMTVRWGDAPYEHTFPYFCLRKEGA